MRVCYLIQSHKNSEQIQRMVQAIKRASPDSLVLLSHDRSCSPLDPTIFEQIPGVKVILCDGSRTDFRFFEAYFEAIAWLVTNQVDFDWLINLSGQDYPIKSLSQAEQFLADTPYDGFMEYFNVFSKDSPWGIREGKTRYCFRYWRLADNLPDKLRQALRITKVVNYIQPLFRVNFSYGLTIGIRRRTPFNQTYICYGGSTFCTLKKKCIEYLYSVWQANHEIVSFLRHSGIPTEAMFQTILLNSHQFEISNECKHYFNFSQGKDGHPQIMTMADLPDLLSSSAFFGRKFDVNVDRDILNSLDRQFSSEVQSHCAQSAYQ